MKFKILQSHLMTEAFVTSFRVEGSGRTANLYKNEDISNLPRDVRGVITKTGDIYCADIPEKTMTINSTTWDAVVIHDDILNKLRDLRLIYFRGEAEFAYGKMEEFINVQRDGKTSNFYLGESYNKNEVKAIKASKTVEEILKKFKKKNSLKNVILEQNKK